jgi:hypothetical protein
MRIQIQAAATAPLYKEVIFSFPRAVAQFLAKSAEEEAREREEQSIYEQRRLNITGLKLITKLGIKLRDSCIYHS